MTEKNLRLILPTHDARNPLRLPLCVNVSGMDESDVRALLSAAEERLGARYFCGVSVFFEVLKERVANAAKPFSFLDGPYLKLFIRPRGEWEIGISSCDRPEGGNTVYTADQFLTLASEMTPAAIEDALDELYTSCRTTPRRPYATDWQPVDDSGLQYSQEIDRYWLNGRVYDERSARHNGLIGVGADLRRMARTTLEDPSP